MPRLLNRVLLGVWLAWFALPSFAQTVKLPPPTRTVYKCDSGEKVTYSDAPCLGAQKVDVQPTRGLNKSSGSERVGKDVRDERRNEIVADAIRPITGMSADERAVQHRRFKLSSSARAECALLDRRLLGLERVEQESTGDDKTETQRKLFEARLRSGEIGC